MQKLIRAWSALSSSTGLCSSKTAHWPHSLQGKRVAMLQVLKSREDGFSSLSQGDSFNDVEDPMNGKEDVHEAE